MKCEELPTNRIHTSLNVAGNILTLSFKQYINALSEPQFLSSLSDIGRGIEREGLRVLEEGRLSEHEHYYALGSALTHPHITTDYAECLLEFITPVAQSPETSIEQLRDIQKYTLTNIDGELIWPTSMPCFVDDEDKVQLAQYGSSNIGTMKTVYRQGLKNRYGSMMQVIAGIHFNFSFPDEFWQQLKTLENDDSELQDYVSSKYFALLRNYKRFCWLIPYLYGSSPAICPSFLQGKETALPFKKSKTGYLYLEHATSLRMSDLGYTNSEQSALHICYNDLDGYLEGVKEAISLPSDAFAKIGIKESGKYQQLNTNVLQIENELYAPVRPKQVAKSGEKPSEALQKRGVEYIEVRALDVNPFADTGISVEQVYFLDVFLTFCALSESPQLDCGDQNEYESNMDDVVIKGRDPKLILKDNGVEKTIAQWGDELFEGLMQVAQLFDRSNQSSKYVDSLNAEYKKILDPTLTPSAKILAVAQTQSLTRFTLDAAKGYRESLLAREYKEFDQTYFESKAKQSHQQQTEIEKADTCHFDQFITDYFKG